MSQPKIFVAGAFNFPAKSVVKEFHQRNDQTDKIRIGIYIGQMPLDLVRAGAEVVRVDPTQIDTVKSALEGIDAAFFYCSEAENDDNILKNYIDTAIEKGVKRVVILSSYHHNINISCQQIEQYIATKGELIPSYTILRVPFFIHHFELYTDSIFKDKVLQLPIGTSATFAPLDDRDFATIVANLLTSPEADHNKKTFTLTGPTLYTGPQLAEKLSGLLKDTVSFRDSSVEEVETFFVRSFPANSPGSEVIKGKHREFYRAIRDGEVGIVSDDAKKFFGIEPRDVDVYFGEILAKRSLPSYMQQFKGL